MPKSRSKGGGVLGKTAVKISLGLGFLDSTVRGRALLASGDGCGCRRLGPDSGGELNMLCTIRTFSVGCCRSEPIFQSTGELAAA